MTVLGWHFTDGDRLANGDDRPIVVGEWLEHEGPLVLCRAGLHFSERAIDALSYAPGTIAWRVEGGGKMLRGDNKIVCQRRKALQRKDAGPVLRRVARACALDVAHLWREPVPAVVRRFLVTGARSAEAAARAAAEAAARAAARAARAARAEAQEGQNARLTAWLLAKEPMPDRIAPEEIAEPAREVVRAWLDGEAGRATA